MQTMALQAAEAGAETPSVSPDLPHLGPLLELLAGTCWDHTPPYAAQGGHQVYAETSSQRPSGGWDRVDITAGIRMASEHD